MRTLWQIMICFCICILFLGGCQTKKINSDNTLEPDIVSAQALIASNLTHLNISNAVWKRMLTQEQYSILREEGTEIPFTGALLHNNQTGIYVTAGCKQPVFSSATKFDSGTGWPSFWEPISNESIKLVPDNSYGMQRLEVVGTRCDEHLGHVFNDGPPPTGLRYCINSAALLFVAH